MKAPAPRSPLAMVVLALLAEGPMHAYRMHELIRERGKDSIVNVAQRNSVYQAIARLERDGLIGVQHTSKAEGRPERVVYRITKEGSETLDEWLKSTLRTPLREYPQFPAALAFVMLLAPDEAAALLKARVATLSATLEAQRSATKAVRDSGLPRLFLVEDEYMQAMLAAEIEWVKALVLDLETGALAWSREWLQEIARRFASS